MKKIGILGLSNPCTQNRVDQVCSFLGTLPVETIVSDCLCRKATAQEKAEVFNRFMEMDLDYVFDISGGDLANTTLPYLDLETYKQSKTLFHGYSDLTCVCNALARLRPCVLFQIAGNQNEEMIKKYILEEDSSLIVEHCMGGNIRCLLKLAGTDYWPDLQGKKLLLESFSGSLDKIQVYLAQYQQMGVFNQIEELIVGQFSEIDQNGQRDALLKMIDSLGVSYRELTCIGHSKDSLAVKIWWEAYGTKRD